MERHYLLNQAQYMEALTDYLLKEGHISDEEAAKAEIMIEGMLHDYALNKRIIIKV